MQSVADLYTPPNLPAFESVVAQASPPAMPKPHRSQATGSRPTGTDEAAKIGTRVN
jgi:hypothetical protein